MDSTTKLTSDDDDENIPDDDDDSVGQRSVKALFLTQGQGNKKGSLHQAQRTFGGSNGDASRQISPNVHILLEGVESIEDGSRDHEHDGRIRLLDRPSRGLGRIVHHRKAAPNRSF